MYNRPLTLFFLIIILILLICLGFTSCGRGKKAEDTVKKDEWQGVISLWDFPRWPNKNGNRFGWIEKKIWEFEKNHPGVFIHLRRLKWEYGMIELTAAASSGTSPDIAPVASDYYFILSGYLEPVDKFISKDDMMKYDKKAIDAVTYDGKIYGFPWFMSTYGLFLNREVFESRDVPLPKDGDWSYDQFVECLQKLTYKKDKKGGHDRYGFNLFLSPGNYQIYGFLTMDGAKIFDENGNFVLNTQEGVSALAKVVDLNIKYKAVPEGEYGLKDEKDVWADFAEKRTIAVYPAASWAVKTLKNSIDAGSGFEFEVCSYPEGKVRPVNFTLVSGYAVFKQQDEGKKEICAEFLKFITSEKEQEALADYGVFPVNVTSQQKLLEDDPHMLKMKELLDFSQGPPKLKNWHKIDEILISHVRLALIGKKTAEQALDDMAREIEVVKSEGRTE
jgi:multiple sugar transport system substrate-binding protein